MIYEYQIEGVAVKTGDILCTRDGCGEILSGQFWRMLGRLLPGEIDHVAIYLGPEGLCVESAARGVVLFALPGQRWDAVAMQIPRAGLLDTLVGVALPLEGLDLAPKEEERIRAGVAGYCLAQASAHKPYNLNFFDADCEGAYYCSQLAYRAYLPFGINLNSGRGIPNLPGTECIIFPQEIWEGFPHRRVVQAETSGG